MIGYTDEQNYKDIANSIRKFTEKEETYKPEDLAKAISEITLNDAKKYDIPVFVFKDVWSKNAIDTKNNKKDPKQIYSEYLTGRTYLAIIGESADYNLKADNYLYSFTANAAMHTLTKETAWEWDIDNATIENPDVYKKTTTFIGTSMTNPVDLKWIKKFNMTGNVTVFSNLFDGNKYEENLEFTDADKASIELPNKNYVQAQNEFAYDSENSLYVITVDNEKYIVNHSEYTELNDKGLITEAKEYCRKKSTDIYCYDIETHYGFQLIQQYDDDAKEYVFGNIDGKEYKVFKDAAYLFYYKKKDKYKIAKMELVETTPHYYECNIHGEYNEGYIRVQGDATLTDKKHGWKLKFRNKIKLDNSWPSSKSYNLKGYCNNGTNTHIVSDTIYTLWRQLTDRRNTEQNPMSLKYWNGTEMVTGEFTNYIDMLANYKLTVQYLNENATEAEVDEYKATKPSILKYIESEGKGATLQKPCLLFWEKEPESGKPTEYVCHGLYSLQIPLCDKTIGYDEDDDVNYCLMACKWTAQNNAFTGPSRLYKTINESAATFADYYRENDPIDNNPCPTFNCLKIDEGKDYNKDIKIAAFNKLIEVANDHETTGNEWLTKLKTVLDVDSLIDYAMIVLWAGDVDKFIKNQNLWIDDASKIGNGSVWHFGIDGFRFCAQDLYFWNNAFGNGLKTDRPAIGKKIAVKTTDESGTPIAPDHFFRWTWTGINQLLLRIWNTTDAVVNRYNKVKDLFELDNTLPIMKNNIQRYFMGSMVRTDLNKDIISETVEGPLFWQTYVMGPKTSFYNKSNSTDEYSKKLYEEYLSKYAQNRMFVNNDTNNIGIYCEYPISMFITGLTTNGSSAAATTPAFQSAKTGKLTEQFKLLGIKNALDFNRNKVESMCSAVDSIDGEDRPAMFSFIRRMKFFGDKEFKNFNYGTDYIDVFGELDYKEPFWVDRHSIGGGEKQENGKFTPNQNNYKTYSNYAVNSSKIVTGFENISFASLILYKLNDESGIYEKVTTTDYIDSSVNGYITFKTGISGSFKIECILGNNEFNTKTNSDVIFSSIINNSDKLNAIKSNMVTIYVSDTETIIK